MTPGIDFEGVWKKFRAGERHDSLRDLIPSYARRMFKARQPDTELGDAEFWAVRDVSFKVQPGEAIGIIGPNGAGKSTTLKLLTKILKPTRGHAVVRGRAGALIEIAAGFHPDLTGRENVFLQGAIMGMSRAHIRQRFDQIVEFAGIPDFIDTQVKRYSSGMNARLGFAIAAHLDPDVMIIDEVLSVGDAGFQDKCVRHMRSMIQTGVPLVFVSHNLPAVLELCTRVIVINRGTVAFDGAPSEGVQRYRSATSSASGVHLPNSPIRIAEVELLEDGAPSMGVFRCNGDVTVRVTYETTEPVHRPGFALDIHRGDGVHCYGTTTFQQHEFGTLNGRGVVDIRLPRLALLPGCYTFSLGIHRTDGRGPYDVHHNAYPFSVAGSERDKGIVMLDHEWAHDGPVYAPPEPVETAR